MKKILPTAFIIFILMTNYAQCEINTVIHDYPEYNRFVNEITNQTIDLSAHGLLSIFYEVLLSEIKSCTSLLIKITILASALATIRIVDESNAGQAAYFAAYAFITTNIIQLISFVIGYGVDVIHSISDFITKLAPILLGLVAISGSPTSAAAFSPILSSSVYITTIVINKIITPLIFISTIIGVIGNFHARVTLNNFNRLLRSISRWILTAIMTLFVSLCAVYGFNAPVFDAIGAKTVRFAVGSLVPVIGGLLSDSLETVIGGTKLLKNAVGSAGMLCIVSMSVLPVIKVWVMMIAVKLCAAIQEPICDRKISLLLSDAGESISLVFSIIVTSVMMFLICIGIIIASTGMH